MLRSKLIRGRLPRRAAGRIGRQSGVVDLGYRRDQSAASASALARCQFLAVRRTFEATTPRIRELARASDDMRMSSAEFLVDVGRWSREIASVGKRADGGNRVRYRPGAAGYQGVTWLPLQLQYGLLPISLFGHTRGRRKIGRQNAPSPPPLWRRFEPTQATFPGVGEEYKNTRIALRYRSRRSGRLQAGSSRCP
jgi:hypothetical protein